MSPTERSLGQQREFRSSVIEAPAPSPQDEPFETGRIDPPGGFRESFLTRSRVGGVAGIAAILALAGVAYYGIGGGPGNGGATVAVSRGDIHRAIAGKGRIEPRAELRLTANMIGRIESILVEEGGQVRRGQVLVQMEDGERRAQLAQSEALLDEARARYADVAAGARPQELEAAAAREREARAVLDEAAAALGRARALLAGGVLSRAQFEEAERRHSVAAAQHQTAQEQFSLLEAGARQEARQAALAQVRRAEADVALARALLEQTTIRAPVAGRVMRRFMSPGEVIVLQRPEPILTLADLSRVQVRAELDETDARFLQVGQTAEITSGAFPGRVFKGKVVEVGNVAGRKSLLSDDPAALVDTKVVEAVVELTDEYPWTFGVTVDVAITVENRENVLTLPRAAIIDDAEGTAAMVATDEGYTRQPVRIGAGDNERVEIVAGLQEGDVVLLQ